ncbi:TAXI family TRAP transporter solute-binding subunit [Alteribacillus sp. YIM 98480]|uniref:TAXI family TRAP transporter solute-binding subunit n=1 Tax=Alteribacillus sp. YIM 98480 TaxID=2606599 RepID=UPI00131B9686|nr:TAXI family TRAP transporter solute-binding subunit [Alteribacillus sp. YIM 98480]
MKRWALIISVCTLITTVGCSGSSESGASENTDGGDLEYSIGAGTTGGGFHTGGTALSNVLNENMDKMETVVEVTGSSKDNVQLMQGGEIELGLSSTEVAWEAFNGEFSLEGMEHDKLRTLLPGWPGVYMFVTLADSEIKTIEDLDGKSYSAGPKGSANEIFAERVFDTFDIEPDVVNLPTSDAANALKDGTVDGFSIAWPSSAVTELETSHEVKIVTLSEEEKQTFLDNNPPYLWLDIPEDAYNAASKGIENFGLYNLFIVSSDIPEETVYEILKTVYENTDTIEQVWPQMAEGMTIENVDQTTIPYHKGAVKFFEEQGADIPEELIPPE